jgi:hypothetical protein
LKTFYILYIFQTKGCWGMWQEGHWGMLERPKNLLLRQQGLPKKTSWVLEILMFE